MRTLGDGSLCTDNSSGSFRSCIHTFFPQGEHHSAYIALTLARRRHQNSQVISHVDGIEPMVKHENCSKTVIQWVEQWGM